MPPITGIALMIVEAVKIAREAMSASNPTPEQLAIRHALAVQKVDAAVAEIDAELARQKIEGEQ